MKITDIRVSHFKNPLGFELSKPVLSWSADGEGAKKALSWKVEVSLDEDFNKKVLDSGFDCSIDSAAYALEIDLAPRTRYYVRVTCLNDLGEVAVSDTAWFETSKLTEQWRGKWITPSDENVNHPIVRKVFEVKKPVKSARVYILSLIHI